MDEESFCCQQTIAECLVGGPGRFVRLSFVDHRAHEEPPARLSPRNCIHFSGVYSVSNPLFLAIITRISARSIAHDPQRLDACGFVRKSAAPDGAVPAHEHFNREFDLELALHRGRLPLPVRQGCRIPLAQLTTRQKMALNAWQLGPSTPEDIDRDTLAVPLSGVGRRQGERTKQRYPW